MSDEILPRMSDDAAPEVRLRRCDLAECQAVCCYNGVFLQHDEEARIRMLVAAYPEHFADLLPDDFVVDGEWRGVVIGRKTVTRPHEYAGDVLPAHFKSTRCVFGHPDGKCSLQTLAVAHGHHPWSYKPRLCWLHPLIERGPRLEPPPERPEDDVSRSEGFPGYVTSTPCGRHDPAGEPWSTVCAEELAYFEPAAPEEPGSSEAEGQRTTEGAPAEPQQGLEAGRAGGGDDPTPS